MQNIIIHHLGPIEHLEMSIEKYNLLIGEQATGKSTLAKCIFYFRNIKDTISDYLCQIYDTSLYNGQSVDSGFNSVLKKELKSIFVSLFGYSWDLNENLYLKYNYASDIWIDVKLNSGKERKRKYISVRYSSKLTKCIRELESEALEMYKGKADTTVSLTFATNERSRNYVEIKNRVNQLFDDYKETYYIPAGRSMLTLLSNQRTSIEYGNMDLITHKYMQIIESIHALFADGVKNVHKRYPDGERKFDVNEVSNYLIDAFKGDYYYAKGKEYIVLENAEQKEEEKVQIPINFASSGQQEVLWLLNQLYILLLKKEKAFVIIEEPEAHLYPVLQKKVMDFIAFFIKMNDSSAFVTTHSPYVLTSVNSLYVAGNMIKKYPEKKKQIYDLLDLKAEIDVDSFRALKITRNREIQNLIDNEMEELTTELIDEISDKINEQYISLFCMRENI